jgi:hypothetical protein
MSGFLSTLALLKHIVTSIRKAEILEAALFTRQRASVYPTTHLVETELLGKASSIQAAKTLLKGESAEKSEIRER